MYVTNTKSANIDNPDAHRHLGASRGGRGLQFKFFGEWAADAPTFRQEEEAHQAGVSFFSMLGYEWIKIKEKNAFEM